MSYSLQPLNTSMWHSISLLIHFSRVKPTLRTTVVLHTYFYGLFPPEAKFLCLLCREQSMLTCEQSSAHLSWHSLWCRAKKKRRRLNWHKNYKNKRKEYFALLPKYTICSSYLFLPWKTIFYCCSTWGNYLMTVDKVCARTGDFYYPQHKKDNEARWGTLHLKSV